MRAIGALSKLHTLRLAHTSFDGEGANELARLPQLTALTLVNSGGVYSTAELASAVAQVRLAELYGPPAGSRGYQSPTWVRAVPGSSAA